MNPKDPIGRQGRSLVVKRSVIVRGYKGSVSLEDAFWNAFKEIAAHKEASLSELVTKIDDDRTAREQINLSSAIRLFVLDHYRRIAELKRGGK